MKLHIAAIKFLYAVTLDRSDVVDKVKFPKVPLKLLDIPRSSEVAAVLSELRSPMYRASPLLRLRGRAPRERGLQTPTGTLCEPSRTGRLSPVCRDPPGSGGTAHSPCGVAAWLSYT